VLTHTIFSYSWQVDYSGYLVLVEQTCSSNSRPATIFNLMFRGEDSTVLTSPKSPVNQRHQPKELQGVTHKKKWTSFNVINVLNAHSTVISGRTRMVRVNTISCQRLQHHGGRLPLRSGTLHYNRSLGTNHISFKTPEPMANPWHLSHITPITLSWNRDPQPQFHETTSWPYQRWRRIQDRSDYEPQEMGLRILVSRQMERIPH